MDRNEISMRGWVRTCGGQFLRAFARLLDLLWLRKAVPAPSPCAAVAADFENTVPGWQPLPPVRPRPSGVRIVLWDDGQRSGNKPTRPAFVASAGLSPLRPSPQPAMGIEPLSRADLR